MTGPERVQAAINRDRGMDAPGFPVTLCGIGAPPPAAETPVQPRSRTSLGERLVSAVYCGACLRVRAHPGHWLSCWRAGDGR